MVLDFYGLVMYQSPSPLIRDFEMLGHILFSDWGWSGGAKVLGNLPVPGRPTNLDYSRARACCACSRCGWGLFGHFLSLIYPFSPLSPSLWETARYRLKYCLKGPLNPKQPTDQSFLIKSQRVAANIISKYQIKYFILLIFCGL